MQRGIAVFSGNAHRGFAEAVCRHLEMPLGDCEVFEFSNENIFVRFNGELVNAFIPIEAVDPNQFEKSNLLGPDKGGAKAYGLLRRAMAESGRVSPVSR